MLGLANSQPTGPAKSLSVWCSRASVGKSCGKLMVNYLTHRGCILPRCYFLGRRALSWGWGASLQEQHGTPSSTKAGRSVAPWGQFATWLSLRDVWCFPPAWCSCLWGAVTGSIWWLTWWERRELLLNWIIFKIMTVWARPTNKNMLRKKIFPCWKTGRNSHLLLWGWVCPWWRCEMSPCLPVSAVHVHSISVERECSLVAKPYYFIRNLLISV